MFYARMKMKDISIILEVGIYFLDLLLHSLAILLHSLALLLCSLSILYEIL